MSDDIDPKSYNAGLRDAYKIAMTYDEENGTYKYPPLIIAQEIRNLRKEGGEE